MIHPLILYFFSLFQSILLFESWIRVRYESTTKIHHFFLFCILIIWLVACCLHMKSNRFDLISKLQDLSISYHATWFTSEFVKAQTYMSILCHSALDDYWYLTHIGILSCSTPIFYSIYILAWHLLVTWQLKLAWHCLSTWHLNVSALVELLVWHIW